jgi:hypothetical protein
MLIFGDRPLRSILAEYEAHHARRRSGQLRPPQPNAPSPALPGADQAPIRPRRAINEYERAG